MPKPKSDKNYFTQDTENAIVEYNNTDNFALKESDILYATIAFSVS